MAGKNNRDGICSALWYHGEPRAKHLCHRPAGHRGEHHADSGLSWSRHPHARRIRLDLREPCPDCEPAGHK